MERYYFTFGSSEQFPYQNTYLVIIASDQSDALKTFREKFPDVGAGKDNYTFCFSEEEWWEKQAKYYEDRVPADIIWSKQVGGDHVPKGFAPVFIYVPHAQQIVIIEEGTGDNLLREDREEGYVDYIMYYQYDLDSKTEQDGGQIMCKQYVQEKYKRLADSVPDVLDMAYGNPHLEFAGLYNFAAKESLP